MSTASYASLADFYRRGPYAAFPQEHRCGGVGATRIIRADQNTHNFTDPAVPELVICSILSKDALFRWNLGDGWSHEQTMQPGLINVCPPETAVDFDCRGRHSISLTCIPTRFIDTLFQDYGNKSLSVFGPLHDRALFADAFVHSTLRSMWRESARWGDAAALKVDGLLMTVIARLLRLSGESEETRTDSLSSNTMTQIDEFIAAHCAEAFSVSDLAKLADLPLVTFSRALRKTTGQTPHQYVLSHRIELARALLAAGDMPLADIAYACGFASQSHMTDVFREKLGVTPGRYRKEVRG